MYIGVLNGYFCFTIFIPEVFILYVSFTVFDLTQPKQAEFLPPITSIVKAASKGNIEIVKEILNNNKDKVC